MLQQQLFFCRLIFFAWSLNNHSLSNRPVRRVVTSALPATTATPLASPPSPGNAARALTAQPARRCARTARQAATPLVRVKAAARRAWRANTRPRNRRTALRVLLAK